MRWHFLAPVRLRLMMLAVSVGIATAPAVAVTPAEVLADPHLEARARVLSQNLRCVVCQNQSIDDSTAPLARDLRLLVRDRLTAGDTNAQALAFIVARYGNFVLLQPPLQANTLALWFGPAAFLLIAAACFGFYLQRRQHGPTGDEQLGTLTAAQKRRLDLILTERHTP